MACRGKDGTAPQLRTGTKLKLLSYTFVHGSVTECEAPFHHLPASLHTDMTKECEVCRTENRDRALYCRRCATRFADVRPVANMSAVPITAGLRAGVAGGASALKLAPAMPQPAPTRVPGPATTTHGKNRMLRVLLPIGVVLSAALVLWLQSPRPGEPRSHPGHEPAPIQSADSQLQTSPAPVPVAVAAQAVVVSAPPAAAPGAVPQESLLALTLEQSAREQRQSQAMLQRTWNLDPTETVTGEALPRTEGPPDTSESAGSIPTGVSVERPRANRPDASRRAVADARAWRRPGMKAFNGSAPAALSFTGPCNRYNPFGEAICANAPTSKGHATVAYREPARKAPSR